MASGDLSAVTLLAFLASSSHTPFDDAWGTASHLENPRASSKASTGRSGGFGFMACVRVAVAGRSLSRDPPDAVRARQRRVEREGVGFEAGAT